MLFEDLERGAGSFLIVESLEHIDGQTYVQAVRREDGGYAVEYRAGGPLAHFGTVVRDFRQAHQLVTGWAFDVPAWRDLASWTPVGP